MTALSRNARIAGLLYIVGSLVGIWRLIVVPGKLFVSGNAPATTANILAHEMLFRWSILGYLLGATIWIFVTLALYRLLNDVDHDLAVLMVILGSLMVTPIFFLNALNDVAALLLARGGTFLSVFEQPQREALVMMFLRLHDYGDTFNEIFWGLWLLPLGLLVYKSRFLPRLIGIWLMIACFGYLAHSFSGLVFPAYAKKIFQVTSITNLGEVALMLWLLIMGARPRSANVAPAFIATK